jgi:hypothetical protein
MNTSPIVSPEDWEAARQRMLAKEKAPMRGGDVLSAERRRTPWMAVENDLRNAPPGPLPEQTEVPARPHAGKAPGYRLGAASTDTTADTRAGEMAQAGPCVADQFEGHKGKVSPTTPENHSRAPSRFLIAFCSGVAAMLAWWSYGDAARQKIASSYPRLVWLAPPRALTAPEAPEMIVPYQNQGDDRVVAGQELTRNTDQTTTSVDQAPSAQAGSIPLESRGDAASSQTTVPSNIKPTEAKALQTSSEKGKQLSTANQYDASCLPSASAVLQTHRGGWPTWTLKAPGHEGTQCWYAAPAPRVSDHRPTQGKRPSN